MQDTGEGFRGSGRPNKMLVVDHGPQPPVAFFVLETKVDLDLAEVQALQNMLPQQENPTVAKQIVELLNNKIDRLYGGMLPKDRDKVKLMVCHAFDVPHQ